MFYETDGNAHGLPHDPFKSCTIPRPIGWISSISAGGVVNVAPYSYFNGVASAPPMVMYANNADHPHGPKDTLSNIEATGEFVCHVATWAHRDAMNRTSLAAEPPVNELELAGLSAVPSRLVKPPRIAESPIAMECRLVRVVDLPCTHDTGRNALVVGHVIGVHIDERVLTDGLIDIAKLEPVARMGYRDYAVIREVFSMDRPQGGDHVNEN